MRGALDAQGNLTALEWNGRAADHNHVGYNEPDSVLIAQLSGVYHESVDGPPLYTDRSTKIFEALKARGLAVGLPVSVLLDRNGCTLGHINGPAEWDSADGRKLIAAAIRSAAPES